MNTLHQSSATWRVAQRAPGRPSSGRWLWGLLRHSSAPNHVVPPDGAADEGVVQDARQIRRALTALSRHRVLLTLQSPDGRHFGTAVLGTTGTQDLVLDWRAGNRDPSGGLPPSLRAMASGDRGLLFFTLHGLATWLLESDLEIDMALNLDGGTSSGVLVASPPEGSPAFVAVPAVVALHAR